MKDVAKSTLNKPTLALRKKNLEIDIQSPEVKGSNEKEDITPKSIIAFDPHISSRRSDRASVHHKQISADFNLINHE